MIPIRDTIPSRCVPWINYTLITLCAAAFFVELSAGTRLESLIRLYGLVPARATALADAGHVFDAQLYVPFVTSIFLHAGWLHFLGNMLFLWIFGDNVEDRMGHLGYFVFYLAGGLVAGLAHLVSAPHSNIPTVGASGAIAAVMGAYFVLYPRARIVSIVIFFFFLRVIRLPAFLYLGLWFALQILQGSAASAAGGTHAGGVAWWAHAGGFAFGLVAALVLGSEKRRR